MSPRRSRGQLRLHPTRSILLAFVAAIAVGTLLLLLPAATATGRDTDLVTALFTATSAVCVTGLIVVDTSTHWSGFGQSVILVLIQLGGLGIMSFATLFAVAFSQRLSLATRLRVGTEAGSIEPGDLGRVLRAVLGFTLYFEVVGAVLLGMRLWLSYDQSPLTAAAQGVFHSISAFNNAGFALYSDSLVGFVDDWWFSLFIAVGVVAGGIGFPVLLELVRHLRRPRRWSMHTKLTLLTTVFLLAVGFVAITVFEWDNPATLGPLSSTHKLLAGAFHSVMPRTAGFNTLDVGGMHDSTLLVTDSLMFVGGGSASTAGGIKVTTFALLGLVIWAELRGDADVEFVRRRVATRVQREALAIALIGVGVVMAGTLVLLALGGFSLSQTLFESISAFGTVGLSTGITPALPASAHLVLVLMMLVGRLGPLTFGAALVMRGRERRFRFPEERPIVG